MRIYCEERKETLNLTISVRVIENGQSAFKKVKELQFNALHQLPMQPRIGTYIYPEETLHFSVLNLTSFDLSVDFNSARNFIEQQVWYEKLQTYIRENILNKLNNQSYNFKFEKFYIPDSGTIEGSLTLNLKPPKNFIKNLERIQGSIKEELYKLNVPLQNFKIKDHDGLFGINILRFLGKKEIPIENCEKFYEYIEKENKKLSVN